MSAIKPLIGSLLIALMLVAPGRRKERNRKHFNGVFLTCEEYYLEPHQRQASLIIIPFLSSNPLLCNGTFNLPVLLVFLGSGL